ncbi:hypothetical protein GQ42DRAFT_163291 [Ramicandelaber brevisporus]|nr:hypothetical protein GQ42DRAFT_163291 [Ramicandelaber brevisporus]
MLAKVTSTVVAAALLLGAVSMPFASAQTTSDAHLYKKGDAVVFQCAKLKDDGSYVRDDFGQLVWDSPVCSENSRPFAVHYSNDETHTCTIPSSHPFFHQLQIAVNKDVPVQCRVPSTKDVNPQYLPVFIHFHGVKSSGDVLRISGAVNALFHGEKGSVIAGAMYSILNKKLPVTVPGVTTISFTSRWYDGHAPRRPMTKNPEHHDDQITPVLLVVYCFLSGLVVYIAGRAYTEGFVIPKLKEELSGNNIRAY